MAQHGSGEQYVKEGHHGTDEYVRNPFQITPVGHDVGGTGTTVQTGAAGTHGHEEAGKGVVEQIKEKLPGGDNGVADDHKAATTTGDHGVADGHKKKGVMEKIKEKLPGGQQ